MNSMFLEGLEIRIVADGNSFEDYTDVDEASDTAVGFLQRVQDFMDDLAREEDYKEMFAKHTFRVHTTYVYR